MMSDVGATMNFEALPNEILIECFEYLNAGNIFYSFDLLNSRFNNLIRNMLLDLNIEGMQDTRSVEFCHRIASNPLIKRQVKSLFLSELTAREIETLSLFPRFDQFSQLQVLSIAYISENLVTQLASILPLITNLHLLRINDIRVSITPILQSLRNTNIKSLLVRSLPQDSIVAYPAVSLVKLVINRFLAKAIYILFEYSPSLQYLEMTDFVGYSHSTINPQRLQNRQLIHLTRVIVHRFLDKFECFDVILKRTPNLKVLIISYGANPSLVDAQRWEQVITTSLPRLKIFKFYFCYPLNTTDPDIVNKFQQFQTDFWTYQHHWYTEYIFQKDRAVIYTVPCASNRYEITPFTRRYPNEFTNNTSTLANVTTLQLKLNKTMVSSEYYFPNVTLLILKIVDTDEDDIYNPSKTEQMQCLKSMINLSNLSHLRIQSKWQLKSLMQLLNEAPHLSSIKLNKNMLMQMLNSHELCECFNKKIKWLDITVGPLSALNLNETSKICQVFSNLEKFQCYIFQTDDLQIILDQLSQLLYMKTVAFQTLYYDATRLMLKSIQSKTNLYSFKIKFGLENFHYNDNDDGYYTFGDDSDSDMN